MVGGGSSDRSSSCLMVWLVIPAFDQFSFTVEVQEKPPPPKVEKLKTEQWITQTIKQEELRSELPPQTIRQDELRSELASPTNKLSSDKVHFLQSKDMPSSLQAKGISPGRLVIPDFKQHSFTVDVQDNSPPSKMQKTKRSGMDNAFHDK